NWSGFDSRPTRLIVSQIDSRVSGSATEPDGLIDRHLELGEGQQLKAWLLEIYQELPGDLIRPRSCAEEPHHPAGCAGKRRRGSSKQLMTVPGRFCCKNLSCERRGRVRRPGVFSTQPSPVNT